MELVESVRKKFGKMSDLSGENLHNADLSDTDLSGANLRGADLSGAKYSFAQLAKCASLIDAVL